MAINFAEVEQGVMDDIAECNAQLSVITELKQKLANNEDLTAYLTESKYHECCETLLRNEDDFGRLLTEVIPCLSYADGGSNYFYYKCEGYLVKIPNSRCCGIDVVLPHYSKVISSQESLLRFSYHNSELRMKNKVIDLWESYFKATSLLARAKIVVNGKFKLIRYLYRLVAKRDNYNKGRLQANLQVLYAQRAEIEQEMETKYYKYLDEQTHYRDVLKKILPIMFKWTNTVRVISSDEGSTVATFTKDNYAQDLMITCDDVNS